VAFLFFFDMINDTCRLFLGLEVVFVYNFEVTDVQYTLNWLDSSQFAMWVEIFSVKGT
jgi:hypothetical protein